jgi:hypothetical protein
LVGHSLLDFQRQEKANSETFPLHASAKPFLHVPNCNPTQLTQNPEDDIYPPGKKRFPKTD